MCFGLSNENTLGKEYYISSLECNAKRISEIVRGHWAIENSLHHVLDVTYFEDDNRTRKDHSAANFSLLRKVSLSLINLNKDKIHYKNKKFTQKKARRMATLDHSYAILLFTGKELKKI